MATRLVIFDFDNTLVDGNTDSLILEMLPGLREISRNYQSEGKGWGEVMDAALATIGKRGLKKNEIDECILALNITETVKNMLLKLLEDEQTDVIILSHSNDYFIDILLLDAGISSSHFKTISTYPAEWNDEGYLEVKRFHQEVVDCRYCPNDFCKGYVLSSFISKVEEEENKKYLTRVYVGDGRADYCASKSLNKNDYVLYRLGFTLHKLIKKNDEKSDAFPNHSSWQSFSEMQEKLDMIMNNSLVNSN